MHNATPHAKMAARAHRKGFSPTLPEDGWHEDRDGPWKDHVKRCVHEGAQVKNYTSGERIVWLNNRRSHREDGPAIEDINGNKEWLVNGQLHRLDGPAIEEANGSKLWYVNGGAHRLDGPAIERPNGIVEFWKDSIRYTDITFTQHFYAD